MSDPNDDSWSGYHPTAANLDLTSIGKGTSLPSNWPITRLFLLKQKSGSNIAGWYENTNSYASPTWTLRSVIAQPVAGWPTSPIVGQLVHNTNTNQIAVCTSVDPIVFMNGDDVIYFEDQFTSYASDADFDKKYIPDGSVLEGDSANNQIDWQEGTLGNTYNLHKLIGRNLNEKFRLRCKLDVDNLTQVASGVPLYVYFGLEGGSGSNLYAAYLMAHITSVTNKWVAIAIANTTRPTTGTDFATAVSTGEKGLEILYDGQDIVISIYSISGGEFNSLVESETISDIQGLINSLDKFKIHVTSAGGDSGLDGTIDWIRLWRGTDSI